MLRQKDLRPRTWPPTIALVPLVHPDEDCIYRKPLEQFPTAREGSLTASHIDALIQKARQEKVLGTCAFVLTAGFCKKTPTAPTKRHPVSMAEQMKIYILRHYPVIRTDQILISDQLVWGMRAEIEQAPKTFLASGRVAKKHKVGIVFCTETGLIKGTCVHMVRQTRQVSTEWNATTLGGDYKLTRSYRLKRFLKKKIPLLAGRL